MKESNRIYLFANFGDWNKVPYGGGEVGNRRTLKLLQQAGFKVITIPKYLRVPNHSILNLIKLSWRIVYNIIQYSIILLFGGRKQAFVHIVEFYGPMIYFEYTLIHIAKLLGYNVVYEMRGGGADMYIKNGTKLYISIFKKAIMKSDVIFSQGMENKPLIESIKPNPSFFYYPNYVMSEFWPSTYPIKAYNTINLVYFGRISPTKNIDIVISTFVLLRKKYGNIQLDIIGNCSDEQYLNTIKTTINESGYEKSVHIYPACNHDQLKKYLSDKHFYIFPSTEPHEGHSNALTEAMAWGVIPIATPQGFNRSVINDKRLIVQELNPNKFANIISSIIDNQEIEKYSHQVYDRISNNYTDIIISHKLKNEYNKLFKSCK